MKRIKIGQIGVCHEHAGAKMDSLRKLRELFEIVGVVDDRSSVSPKFAGGDLKPYGGLPWLTEAELFATPGLQAVLVETPNADLVPTALRCLEQGLAIHMDKPGGYDLALFDALRRGYGERRLPFQMGYMFRANLAMQWCQQAVREGWLGEIFEVQASMSHNYGGEPYQAYIGQLDGGIMYNLGCHMIDQIVAIMGRPQAITPFLKATPGETASVLNNGLAILEYPNATATVRVCSRDITGFENRHLKIGGTNGTVHLRPVERFDGQPLTLSLALREAAGGYSAGTHLVDFGVQHDRYEDQLRELADQITGKIADPITCQHDVLVQEVVLAAAGLATWKD